MKFRIHILCFFLSMGSVCAASAATDGIVSNCGQLGPTIRYSAACRAYSVGFRDDGLVLCLRDPASLPPSPPGAAESDDFGPSIPPVRIRAHAVWIDFVGASPSRRVEGRGRRPEVATFIRGDRATDWISGVPAFDEVVYHDLWPGIALVFSIDDGALIYRVEAGSGADPAAVRFRYRGADRIDEETTGITRIETSVGALIDERISRFGGSILRVGSGNSASQDGIPGRDDPSALKWGTYLGGSQGDYAYAIARGSAGRAIVTGTTLSADFPATPGAYDVSPNGDWDVFVSAIDTGTGALLWSTFLGGGGADLARAIVEDGAGDLLLTGKTESPDFPTTPGAFDRTFGGAADVFVAKLSASGDSLRWSTLLGAADYEIAFGLAADPSAGAIVAGYTQSYGYPTTRGAFDEVHNGGFDLFVTKLDADGHGLVWSTLLGGGNDDRAYDLARDSDGNILLTAWTQSPDFPTTDGAYDRTYNGSSDAYVAKLSGSGSALIWSTFLGGGDLERAYGVAIDAEGNPVVTGLVHSFDFPVTAGAFDQTYNGNGDGFVAKLDRDGAALLWSTFLGGQGDDQLHDIGFDAGGRPVVTGNTLSEDYPITLGSMDGSANGGGDAVLTVLEPAGDAIRSSTYLGGGLFDNGNALAAGEGNDIFVVGETESVDFPTTLGGADSSANGQLDGFAVRLGMMAVSGIANEEARPRLSSLEILPNPFRLETRILARLPVGCRAGGRVFDAAGRVVRVLAAPRIREAGLHEWIWDGRDDFGRAVPSGVYQFCPDAGPWHWGQSITLLR